jgi:hypothetical protein
MKLLLGSTVLVMTTSSIAADAFLPRDERAVLEVSGAQRLMPGEYMLAYERALTAFRGSPRVPKPARNLSWYDVLFYSKEDHFLVHFLPRVDTKGVSLMSRGAMDVTVRVRRKDYVVESLTFGQ